jgi:hypothetical protein
MTDNLVCITELDILDKKNDQVFAELSQCAKNVAEMECESYQEKKGNSFVIEANELPKYRLSEFNKCFLPARKRMAPLMALLYECVRRDGTCTSKIEASEASGQSLEKYKDQGVNQHISGVKNVLEVTPNPEILKRTEIIGVKIQREIDQIERANKIKENMFSPVPEIDHPWSNPKDREVITDSNKENTTDADSSSETTLPCKVDNPATEVNPEKSKDEENGILNRALQLLKTLLLSILHQFKCN